MPEDLLIRVYLMVWALLAVGNGLLFWGKSAAFKRRWHSAAVLFHTTAITGFMLLLILPHDHGVFTAVLLVLTASLIAYLSIKGTKFCDGCGKTLSVNVFQPVTFCSECGTAIQP